MSIFKSDADAQPCEDLRCGLRGHLVVREAPLVGADPLHKLDEPHLVAPSSQAPAGQATHS